MFDVIRLDIVSARTSRALVRQIDTKAFAIPSFGTHESALDLRSEPKLSA